MALPTTTARSWSSAVPSSGGGPARAALVACAAAGLLAGCVPPVAEPGPPVVSTTVVTATPAPAVAAARDALAEPAVAVVEHALDLARRIDFTRHEVPRGDPMRAEVDDAREVAAQLDARLAELDAALAALPDGPGEARDAARSLAATARDVRTRAGRELDDLAAYAAVDQALEAVVDTWTARGSRSEFAERLTALVPEAEDVLAQARHLPASPPQCPGWRTNRIVWATLVLQRSAQLRDVAVAAAGTAYDQLRDRFERAPFGEDRRIADAEHRRCWMTHQDLTAAPSSLTADLEALETALSG